MEKRSVHTDKAPAAIGPYSQAIVLGQLVYTSGQIGLDPATGQIVAGGVAAEAERVLQNLSHVLDAAGSSLELVVKTTIFLTEMSDFATVNEIYGKYFTGVAPARSTVAVKALPRGAVVEIEAVAAVDSR
jgi:2-iminobutanoate/2-iminopropanoate deaminase